MDEREKSKPQQSKDENSKTDKPTQLGIGSFPKAPDSHPIFNRGFAIGGKGFNRSRPTKKKPQ